MFLSGLFLLPTLAALVGGGLLLFFSIRTMRRNSASLNQRVQVTAYVVKFSNFRSPYSVVFDYPLPDGSWARAQRMVARMDYSLEDMSVTNAIYIEPGFRFPVYVNVNNPHDVSVSLAAGGGLLPVLGIFFGGLLVAIGALFASMMWSFF